MASFMVKSTVAANVFLAICWGVCAFATGIPQSRRIKNAIKKVHKACSNRNEFFFVFITSSLPYTHVAPLGLGCVEIRRCYTYTAPLVLNAFRFFRFLS